MRTLPPELVEAVNYAIGHPKGSLADDAINAVFDHYSKPENVTERMLSIDIGRTYSADEPGRLQNARRDIWLAMISAIGADDETARESEP